MKTTILPDVLEVPWTMKPLDSASTRVDWLDDGRLHLSIRHDVIRGVTPEMVCWWFQHIGGDMLLEGRRVSRYRAWHPRDHIAWSLERKRAADVRPGDVFHIRECFGRDPRWMLDTRLDVIRLDAGGFATRPRMFGLRFAHMNYTFTRVPGGTLYENDLTVGIPNARRLNGTVVPRVFPEARGRAWLLHNVEEVGNLEFFLPGLHAGRTLVAA